MLARALVLTDLHKRYKDSTSIKGQLEVQQEIQEDIINFVKAKEITHIFITGDWYDRGFHGLAQAYGAMEMDRRISKAVNGNVYLCVGNHFYLERDENPEMYIIQPNPLLKPQYSIPLPEEPIFKVVPQLMIGKVQIDFFHYSKTNKEYISYREPDTKFHIGIYHDDKCVPGWVREQEGYTGTTSQTYLNNIYANIDLAIHGHIHTRIGMTNVQIIGDKKVPICIPGSLGITQNKESMKHPYVQLPVIEISDDSEVSVMLAKFSTHIDKLKFYAPKKKNVQKNNVSDLLSGTSALSLSSASMQTLPNYLLSKGYSQVHLNLVDAAVAETLSVYSAVQILAEGAKTNAEQC